MESNTIVLNTDFIFFLKTTQNFACVSVPFFIGCHGIQQLKLSLGLEVSVPMRRAL